MVLSGRFSLLFSHITQLSFSITRKKAGLFIKQQLQRNLDSIKLLYLHVGLACNLRAIKAGHTSIMLNNNYYGIFD